MAERQLVIPDSQFETIPLAQVDLLELESLLSEEVSAWQRVLHWDYGRTAQLIHQYAAGGLIPGVVLRCDGRVVGYGYYLLRAEVGSVGSVFASPARTDPAAAGARIFTQLFRQLVGDAGCRRVEGQLFSLTHSWANILRRLGLVPCERFYMVRNLNETVPSRPIPLWSWKNGLLPAAAQLLFLTYQSHIDTRISVSYQSMKNCSDFLRNLILMPGCGDFVASSSFTFLDARGELGGFVLTTQISPGVALIPQLCVRPDLQGKGIGSGLLEGACTALRSTGFEKLFLCVTGSNPVARQLYLSHHFRDVQSFSAFFWNRN